MAFKKRLNCLKGTAESASEPEISFVLTEIDTGSEGNAIHVSRIHVNAILLAREISFQVLRNNKRKLSLIVSSPTRDCDLLALFQLLIEMLLF